MVKLNQSTETNLTFRDNEKREHSTRLEGIIELELGTIINFYVSPLTVKDISTRPKLGNYELKEKKYKLNYEPIDAQSHFENGESLSVNYILYKTED